MGRFDTTKATINANIKSNGNQEITGSVLNSVLQEMVDGTDAQLTELSAEVINEVNRKGFLIDASIEGWNREDYNLYIDYIYRNDPNYGSGIRVIDEQGATIVYMVFQDTKKKGIDKVSQDTEYGKVTLVVNWDYFNDGYNAILENRIAVPNTAFLNTSTDLREKYAELTIRVSTLENKVSAGFNTNIEKSEIVKAFQSEDEKPYDKIFSSSIFSGFSLYVGKVPTFDCIECYYHCAEWDNNQTPVTQMMLQIRKDDSTGEVLYTQYINIEIGVGQTSKVLFAMPRQSFNDNLYVCIRANAIGTLMRPQIMNDPYRSMEYPSKGYYTRGNMDENVLPTLTNAEWDCCYLNFYNNTKYSVTLATPVKEDFEKELSSNARELINEYLGTYDYPSFQENYIYITGEIVVYNDMLYRFVKVHKGVWDYNDVTQVTFNSLLADGVNRKGFFIDASIEGWTREDYNLYIDYIYRNDPNYGSGIRVVDANGGNVAYMIFGEYKKGIDKVSQDTEYGKITLVVNWDVLNDGDNGSALQNKIIIPNTAFKKSDSSKGESVKVHLPSTIYAVVGDTLQVFYRGCVQAVNPYNYNILVTCDKGKQFPRYWEYTPTSSDIGTATLKISVRDNALNALASATCKVVTIAKGTNPSSIMNVACFGDSLTAGGDWCAEAARRLTGEGGQPSGDNLNNIAFVGKKKKDGYGYYGEGGWTWKSYTTKDAVIAYRFYVKDVSSLSLYATYSLGGVTYTINEINVTSGVGNILCVPNGNATPPSSGTMTKVTGNGDLTIAYTSVQQVAMNPLWDESNNKMSFVPYANDFCNGKIDVVYTLLTWNNLWTNKELFSDIIDDVKIFADTLHREFPSAKLKIMGIQIPSVTGGMGANYGSSGEGYADQYGMAITAFKLNSAYKDFAAQDTYKDFVEYIDIASQFDTEYNMPYEMAKVNVRSSQTEMRGTNGVHPSMEGYMQIADVVYRSICSEL